MRSYNIAAIPGDGIGQEVVAAAVEVLLACAERDKGFALDFTNFDWGSERYKKFGALMPADGIETLKQFDAILFGSVGAPDVPDQIMLCGLRLAICQSLEQYANVRPARILKRLSRAASDIGKIFLDILVATRHTEPRYQCDRSRSGACQLAGVRVGGDLPAAKPDRHLETSGAAPTGDPARRRVAPVSSDDFKRTFRRASFAGLSVLVNATAPPRWRLSPPGNWD